MTNAAMTAILKTMTKEEDEEVLLAYLDFAGQAILNKCYPFRADAEVVPAKYHSLQVEIAGYLLNKRGAEGETAHSEGDVARSYESASIPESMLKNVIPFAGVFEK